MPSGGKDDSIGRKQKQKDSYMINIIARESQKIRVNPIKSFKDIMTMGMKPFDVVEFPNGTRFVILQRLYSQTYDHELDIWGFLLLEVNRNVSF